MPLCQRVGLDKVSLKLWQEQQESLACVGTWQADPGMAVWTQCLDQPVKSEQSCGQQVLF